VVGVHTNGGPGGFPAVPLPADVLQTLSPIERDRIARVEAFMAEEFGYIAIQSTRPQTPGYGLSDSPVGQLAWIMDKFREWTYPREALPDSIISRDRLLTNVMMYWLTGTAASAAYVGYGSSPRPITPSPAGSTWTAADTSPRWRNQTAWSATSATSSEDCDDSSSHPGRRLGPKCLCRSRSR
jgi:epoxide hydrolase